MTESKYSVVFMGCPDFSIPSLQALINDPKFEVVGAFCMPDRPKGRGKRCAPTPVKQFCQDCQFPVYTPSSLRKDPEAVETLKKLCPDFLVVVAYGLILPQEVLDIPKIAPVNVHASILPKYRGPSPIHQALIDGLSETGISIMLMSKGMDEGDILATKTTPINAEDNLQTLHDRLSIEGAELLPNVLKDYATGKIKPSPQNHTEATYTSKISSQTARIDWQNNATSIFNLIRAMNPCPGAWFEDGKQRLKVFAAEVFESTKQTPGTILSSDRDRGIVVACGNNSSIKLLMLQRPGKSRLSAAEFLQGYVFPTQSFT